MTIERFNALYGNKGGIKQLTKMRDDCETLLNISTHFGVSKERVRQWMEEIFNSPYDPRAKRREIRVEAIKKLIQLHGVEKTKQLYSGINKSYLAEAIKNI